MMNKRLQVLSPISSLGALLLLTLTLTLSAFGPFKWGDSGAEEALATAQSQIANGDTQGAIKTLRGLRLSYGDTEPGYEGTALLGVLLLEDGDPEAALQAAQGVLQGGDDAPTSAQNTAHLVAGLALFEMGRLDEAESHLKPLEGVVTTRGDVYLLSRSMAEITRKKGQSFDRARWLIYLDRSASKKESALYRVDLQALILGGLSQAQLEELGRIAGDAYPRDYIRFALAREAFDRGDFENAIARLKSFITTYPNHPLKESVDLLLLRAERGGALEPSKVGVILPLSGRFAVPGQAVKRGIELARDNMPPPAWAPGGIEFIFRDTEGDGEIAAAAVRDLTLEDNVVAILGPLVSAEAEAAARTAQELEIPIITLTQKAGITAMGSYVFRAFPTAEKQLGQLARYVAEEMGITRVGILYPENSYGSHSANFFWDDIEDRGVSITAVESYKPGQEDYTPIARQLSQKYYAEPRRSDYAAARAALKNDSNPSNDKDPIEVHPIIDFEALFVPDSYRAMNLIAPALAYVEIPVGRFTVNTRDKPLKLIGGNTWNHPEFPRIGGDYVVGSVFVADYFAKAEWPQAKEFRAAYRATFNTSPETFSAHGFDATSILLSLLKQEEPRSRRALAEGLATAGPFDGATGQFSFDAQGDLERDAFILSVNRRGDIIQLYPPVESGD